MNFLSPQDLGRLLQAYSGLMQQQLSQNHMQMPLLPAQLLTPPNSSPECISSASSSSDTPRRRKKTASTFCRLCEKDVSPPSGKKNQGPLRHVRQVHMNGDKVYQCKFCSFSAHYDKTHVITHLRRHHQDAKPSAENVIDNSKSFKKKTEDLILTCFKREDVSDTPSAETPFSSPTASNPDREQTKEERSADASFSSTSSISPPSSATTSPTRGFTIDQIISTH
ncbi:hypothetical protein QR680_004979 [Steinernema hermaphroditum]|uniref:C2H2-type domain-containing protein n=1 Tax=Steinernema hermaphroditum TaxID=289476 RepID=A0AA39HSQ7_9BILA|nr:hypothetical protein QR680_004979 [Steinernema hermaphroditum]